MAHDPRKFVEGPLREFLSGPRRSAATGPKVCPPSVRREPVPAWSVGDVVLLGEQHHEIARVLDAHRFELESGAVITIAG